jgi:predicted GIY-YIG superfamily endonuclease
LALRATARQAHGATARRLSRRSPEGVGGLLPTEGALHYVYILESLAEANRFYVGLTSDLRARLQKHNRGDVTHTSKHLPWRIKTYVAFSSREQAAAFERYLKTASGRAFAKKRL